MNARVTFRRFLRSLCSLVAAGLVALPIVSCGGKHAHSAGVVLEVTPAVASIASGTDVQLVAMALYPDGTKQDVTTGVAWSSTDMSVATVDSGEIRGGIATGLVPGTATIEALFAGAHGTTQLTVTGAILSTIEVTPAVHSIAKAATLQFTATGVFTDHSTQDLTQQVVWTSSNELVATFSGDAGSAGLATGVDVGNATIFATFSGVSGATALAITPATLSAIDITPADPLLAKGTTLQLTATGIYSDGTHQDLTAQATWQSDDPAIAAVSDDAGTKGMIGAADLGQAQVSATLLGVSGATSVGVTQATLDSIAVAPAQPTLAKGTQLDFSATGTFSDGSTQDLTAQAVWESSDPAVCALSNAPGNEGHALALDIGSATVSARLAGLSGATQLTVTQAALVSIAVDPPLPTLVETLQLQFTASGVFSDGTSQDLTQQVTWSSSNAAVAAVSNESGSQGNSIAIASGSTTVSAQLLGHTGATTLNVVEAQLDSIEVAPAHPTIAKGTELSFSATGIFTDGSHRDLSTQVTWSSSDASVANVSNADGSQGLGTGLAVGTASISAQFGGTSGSTVLTVNAATLVSIEVTPPAPTIANGTFLQFVATGVYTDGSMQDLSAQVGWSSSSDAASISNSGNAQGQGVGSATISATLAGTSGSTTLAVADAALVSVSVSPASLSLPLGTAHAFVATATFTDGSVQDVTGQVTWVSSDTGVASIANAPASPGMAGAHGVGNAAISATLQGISGSAHLTVTGAVLTSIAVTPADPTISQGYAVQLVATGTYSDASTLDLTGQVTWSSSAASIADVSNAAPDHGRAFGNTVGSATITATLEGFSDSTVLTVDARVLVSIEISPLAPSVPKSFQVQFAATGQFSDGSTQDFTALVAWASSDSSKATISNAPGSNGLATSSNPGTCTISFAYQSFSDSTQLTVTHAKPVSAVISPSSVTLAVGGTLQLSAIATFDDGSVMDVTQQRDWTCSHPDRVSVGSTSPTRGLVTGLAPGESDVQVHVGGLNVSVHVTVQ